MVLAKTISRKNQLMSVATKIGIQLNAKLGGEIWGVTIPVCEPPRRCLLQRDFALLSVEDTDDHWHGFLPRFETKG